MQTDGLGYDETVKYTENTVAVICWSIRLPNSRHAIMKHNHGSAIKLTLRGGRGGGSSMQSRRNLISVTHISSVTLHYEYFISGLFCFLSNMFYCLGEGPRSSQLYVLLLG